MYELTVDTHFDAAHCLKGYDGECARVHGHTWLVSVTVEAGELDELGLSIDFKDISAVLKDAVEKFDHQMLNELEEFKEMNPTSENLARFFYNLLSEKLNKRNVSVLSITVGESDSKRVMYRP